jgi:RNA polymerase sigma-70 factor (ECF subfamily)
MEQLSPNMHQAVRGLPEKFSEVLWLVDVHELSYREAAQALEVPVGTVMSRLSRGRRRLAALLGVDDSVDQAA